MAPDAPGLGQLAQLVEVEPKAIQAGLGALFGYSLRAQGGQQAVCGALGDTQLARDV
jgi:hypothetical protein